MNIIRLLQVVVILVLLDVALNICFAATVTGSVKGPDGLVAGTRVLAHPGDGSSSIELAINESGQFTMDVQNGWFTFETIAPLAADGLIGETVGVEISDDRELRLRLYRKVNLSGSIDIQDGYSSDLWVGIYNLLTGEHLGAGYKPNTGQFSFDVAAGAYAIFVRPGCFDPSCPRPEGFSSISIDARYGSVDNMLIPFPESLHRELTKSPPNASLITIGPADDFGIATVTGEPGAVLGTAQVIIINLNSGSESRTLSSADGSFEARMYAPPGSWLSISHNQFGFGYIEFPGAPSTMIQSSVSSNAGTSFTALLRAHVAWLSEANSYDHFEVLGSRDSGRIWLTGELTDTQLNQGNQFSIEGDIFIYSQNANLQDTGDIEINVNVYLARIFDENGVQERANTTIASNRLSRTGLAIENQMRRFPGDDMVYLGELQFEPFVLVHPARLESRWSFISIIPENIPDGTYHLVFKDQSTSLPNDQFYFENIFPDVEDNPQFEVSTGGLQKIGSPEPGRLSWALGMNDFSNGRRGTVAVENRDTFQISGRVSANDVPFIVPMHDAESNEFISYRLEPWMPLAAGSNRAQINPPTVPFAFPSGRLMASVEAPNGERTNIAEAPFAQSYFQEPTRPDGGSLDNATSNLPRQVLGLTTLEPRFDHIFTQYGLHRVSLNGSIFDTYGNEYSGGGTYEIWVAKHLDLEMGVFTNTPFEVGDSFSPTVIVQPGVAAEIEITLQHFPNSVTGQSSVNTIRGTANRFGYFHPDQSIGFSFDEPGEYRVDVVAKHLEADGTVWMGAETWASVIETPDSPLITHGKRNFNRPLNIHQQWYFEKNTDINVKHLPFPYHTGDIAWMLDLYFDESFTGAFPDITIQDTLGEFDNYLINRFENNPLINLGGSNQIFDQISIGQIPLISSRPDGISALLFPDLDDTDTAYAYTAAARPGVRVRDLVVQNDAEHAYWRFEDAYYYQPGVGANGDLPNDFKFQFGGAVYRAPEMDFYYYGAYASLWVMLPNDDPDGIRVMPPFQGNGGGPSGGPILSLKGRDIDMFLHPMGVRPGSILELGDIVAFSGQIAPTLATSVAVRIMSPSGVEHEIAGVSNKIGYFYDPTADFAVDEAGVWQVFVETTFEGITSAGQVSEPLPKGDVLGSPDGTYKFYVVEPNAAPLGVDIPAHSWVEPGKGPLNIILKNNEDLTDLTVHRTTVMPGFLLEEAETSNTTYTYDAPALHQNFPNLDLADIDYRTGVDTVTMSFLITGVNGSGKTIHRARQVLLQGEELLAPQQLPTASAGFEINAGLNDAWYNPLTTGQGFFINVFPDIGLVFLAWFSYDTERPDASVMANIGEPGHRWLTAFGSYSEGEATLDIEITKGGVFNSAEPMTIQGLDGSITLRFSSCNSGTVTYDIPSIGRQGVVPIERVALDNVPACEQLAGLAVNRTTVAAATDKNAGNKPEAAGFQINRGLNDAWFNPLTSGQGFFMNVFPDIGQMFLAWFTYDTERPDASVEANLGDPGHRWITAFGSYTGNQAELEIEITVGGLFDQAPPAPSQHGDGTVTVNMSDCENGTVTYDITSAKLQGQIPIQRIALDNVPLCESLGSQVTKSR